MLAASRLICRHVELLAWLNEARDYLPHRILIAAWGDFQRGNVKTEVISQLLGPRSAQWRGCTLDDVVRAAHGHWMRGRREPLVPTPPPPRRCGSLLLRAARRAARPAAAGGARRTRQAEQDSLYIVPTRAASCRRAGSRRRARAMVLCQLTSSGAGWQRRVRLPAGGDATRLP
jgi:hypothetical protein